MFIAKKIALPIVLATAVSAQAQTSVTVSTSRPAEAGFRADLHQAHCNEINYELAFYRHQRNAFFSSSINSAGKIDISNTKFAQTLLKQPLLGHLGLSCSRQGLNITFIGVDFTTNTQPKGVTYKLTILNNGSFIEDQGLVEVPLDYVGAVLGRNAEFK
ncbi:hypothetical protein [Pseudoduganella violacea]|uniref:Uncharacterized protein n=1 Tax=Pseudoduganella violacea TaxID=1715466 RepID=A0A7W5BAA3_9BURK|nr:hypothetical protein [Pseudoduganella violacea]MBB3119298.1 hypothetical protein [Pseudoduganella violacea]